MTDTLNFIPLDGASFGAVLEANAGTSPAVSEKLLANGKDVRRAFHESGGLLVIRGLEGLRDDPEKFLRLAEIFGPEVENIRQTLTAERFFHDSVPEIMVLSNLPPCEHPPPPCPEPSHNADGSLVVSCPHQSNWHTDQSYRRPPPDVTLLYAIETPPRNQGQTLFADCTAAYDALAPETKARIENLEGIHAMSWIGRREADVRSGVTPRPLLPHQLPQRHPLVRVHPETGRRSLYLCDSGQMDFLDGPVAGLEPGPGGAGAELIRSLMHHVTQPRFVHIHEWQPGDLVIGDNRCLLHAATWYDADRYPRLLWRATVMGNPGAAYAGAVKSWIPAAGRDVMEGMEDA